MKRLCSFGLVLLLLIGCVGSVSASDIYIWKRYNVVSDTTYTETSTGSGSFVMSGNFELYRSKTKPVMSSGKYSLSDTGSAAAHVSANRTVDGYWVSKTSNSTMIYLVDETTNRVNTSTSEIIDVTVRYSESYSISSSTTYSMGTYKDEVSSGSKSTYPANGRSGSYWYVLKTAPCRLTVADGTPYSYCLGDIYDPSACSLTVLISTGSSKSISGADCSVVLTKLSG